MIDPSKDGIDHINIYSQGKTQLGRMLSNFYRFKINTLDGVFSSVESYWYWLGIQDCKEKERLRRICGYDAKRLGSELMKKYGTVSDDQFEEKILNAIWYKIDRNMDMFYTPSATLPFEHYYNFGGKIVDVKPNHLWMIEGIDKMRLHIIKGDEPDD